MLCICAYASNLYFRVSKRVSPNYSRCLHYPPIPQYCKLITDPDFPCCQKPYCEIPGIMNSTFGMGTTMLPVVTTRPPMVFTTTTAPRPGTFNAGFLSNGNFVIESLVWIWYRKVSVQHATCIDFRQDLFQITKTILLVLALW